jgi:dTDP-4-dehydrorhamnose reductase
MNTQLPKILILGSTGMLGNTVFKYLQSKHPTSVWGTTRSKQKENQIFFLDAKSTEKNLQEIINTTKIDYVINCIGILRSTIDVKELIKVNALFPNKLADLAEQYDFKLIHISTDAVFSEDAIEVYEDTPLSPTDLYGMSKVLGEPQSEHTLTFRTSILGHDFRKKKGVLSWIDNEKKETIAGYTNQTWTGCTTLQFAKLCEDIIIQNKFPSLRKQSPVYHFAPIEKTTKYELINQYAYLMHKKITIEKQKDRPITRLLATKYIDSLYLKNYSQTISNSLKDLLSFERVHYGK